MDISGWAGPAIIAAIVSALVSIFGWFATHHLDRKMELQRRDEKIRDFIIAIRAEIRSELNELRSNNLERHLLEIKAKYRVRGYSVTVSTPAPHIVFAAIVSEIQLLPEDVIDPVVLYTRQRHSIEAFAADLRTGKFAKLAKTVQISMYTDYIGLKIHQVTLAERAIEAINIELERNGNLGQ